MVSELRWVEGGRSGEMMALLLVLWIRVVREVGEVSSGEFCSGSGSSLGLEGVCSMVNLIL